jgi:hypothetical protein
MADVFVGADARPIAKEPPAADACCRVDGPEPPPGVGEQGSIIASRPEDHGRAITRRSTDRRPAATQGRFFHAGLDLTKLLRRLYGTYRASLRLEAGITA